jgi:hypothetical protein
MRRSFALATDGAAFELADEEVGASRLSPARRRAGGRAHLSSEKRSVDSFGRRG